ncbi:OB-fold nucleic acid binding domain-containing protein [Naumannella cuiyingiana]|uniref:OB domain-containing protein n=1 Tax=Naumannella cuiyingiana TaxID=1347891 RepID=A0A7Z0DBR9_9ACTN|nr:OB-fold nucleic acid binding domain-containing protein [Naumannella cuiyingiana]NYI72563.1 hypothetical protein [Naumannella cuiyingiana]
MNAETTSRRRSGNPLTRALRRFTSSNDELVAQDRREAAARDGATPVADCTDRQEVVLTGTVSCLTLAPAGGTPRLVADLDDGSGQARLVWMGRREIRGIEAGTVLRVTGRVSCQQTGRVLYNPSYEIISTPN